MCLSFFLALARPKFGQSVQDSSNRVNLSSFSRKLLFGLLSCHTFLGSPQETKAFFTIKNECLKRLALKKQSDGTLLSPLASSDLAFSARCPLSAKVLFWLELEKIDKTLPFEKRVQFFYANPTWPLTHEIKMAIEESLHSEIPPQDVLRWFTKHSPRTGRGINAYLIALEQQGHRKKAEEKARHYWHTYSFNENDERLFWQRFKKYLTSRDHIKRMDYLLWHKNVSAAKRVLPFLPKDRALWGKVRLLLLEGQKGVSTLIPQLQGFLRNDPGLQRDRTLWRKKHKVENHDVFFRRKKSPSTPFLHLWEKERLVLTREAVNEGDYQRAYDIIHGHNLSQGVEFAKAEWIAGWLCLRFLNKPHQAIQHFERLLKNVSKPQSKSRALYWLARAYEKAGESPKAQSFYKKAAEFITCFYGQLAFCQINQEGSVQLASVPPVSHHFGNLKSTELAKISYLLFKAGLWQKAQLFASILLMSLPTEEEKLAWLTLLENHAPPIAASLARCVTTELKYIIPGAYPNLQTYEGEFLLNDISPHLLHALIRRESSFDTTAVSPAGACGLMQLRPATAQQVANLCDLPFCKEDLLEKPHVNVRLGTHYLAKLLGQYNYSYVLSLAAYNAGPTNANRWVDQHGSLNPHPDQVVDWIEKISFEETRNYIQRILEDSVIYHALLSSSPTTKKEKNSVVIQPHLLRRYLR